MTLIKCIFVAAVLCCLAKYGFGCHKYSCEDVKSENRAAKSGEYELRNKRGQRFKAYCEFHRHYGYTFVAKADAAKIDMPKRCPCSARHVLVRHLRSNGRQYDTVMEQITSRFRIPLSVQYNKNVGYNTPINHATRGPYIYLGFLPKSVAKSKTTQGYRANHRDFTFRNCDANPNSYLAFFVNPKNQEPQGYYKKCCYTKLMRDWINVGIKASTYLPWNYFFQFEMHMGGCGGYAVNGYNTFSDIVGAAIGFQFRYPNNGTELDSGC